MSVQDFADLIGRYRQAAQARRVLAETTSPGDHLPRETSSPRDQLPPETRDPVRPAP